MNYFIPFNQEIILSKTQIRPRETKLGQVISTYRTEKSKFEIIGIPESIGVSANYGVRGTETAWDSFLSAFLNIQVNRFLDPEILCLGGYFEFPDFSSTNITEQRAFVESIDQWVAEKIKEIIIAGKTPVVIGGGHNNAYGNIKGAFQALNTKISVVNLDAHADFRILEGRHSGNGFSYASADGYLKKYTLLGLKKMYASEEMLERLESNKDITIHYFDDLIFDFNLHKRLENTFETNPVGIEIDLDVIENTLSSAVSPVGFNTQQTLHFIRTIKNKPNLAYLHLCEGAEKLSDGRKDSTIGKLITHLVYEFIT